MSQKLPINSEIKQLEKFIKDKFNLEIYEDIEENPHLFECEPLKFLQILDETNLFIRRNRENLLIVRKHLKTAFPNRTYFLKRLGENLQRFIDGYGLAPDQKKVQELSDLFDNSNEQLKEVLEIVHKEQSKAEKVEPLASELQTVKFDESKTEKINMDENLKKTLTARQWTIALRFFINHFGLREIDVFDFARLLAVLNGGKNLQNFRAELGNEKGLITAKTREKAKEIANLYRACDLPKIADEIERSISSVKSNDL